MNNPEAVGIGAIIGCMFLLIGRFSTRKRRAGLFEIDHEPYVIKVTKEAFKELHSVKYSGDQQLRRTKRRMGLDHPIEKTLGPSSKRVSKGVSKGVPIAKRRTMADQTAMVLLFAYKPALR